MRKKIDLSLANNTRMSRLFPFIVCLILCLFASCSKDDAEEQGLYFPSVIDNTWETLDTDSMGIDPVKLDTLIQFVRTRKSHSLIVLQKGRILVEKYWLGFTLHKRDFVASIEKGFVAFLVGKAREQGLLSLDD